MASRLAGSIVSKSQGVFGRSLASNVWCRPECGWNSVWRIPG
jgi:hypothetical protein